MAKYCLSTITIEGVDYSLMQISDPQNVTGARTIEYPSNVSDWATNFRTLFTNQFVTTNISKDIDALLPATMVDRYNLYQGAESNSLNIYINNQEVGGSSWWSQSDNSQVTVYFGIVVDDESYKACIISGIKTYSWNYYRESSFSEAVYEAFVGAIPGQNNGAGSGYIGNNLLSAKKMVGYNVPTSSTASTKTESVNTYSAEATANTPKSGNGHARITWLRNI